MRVIPSVTLPLLAVSMLVSLIRPVQADAHSENPRKAAPSDSVAAPDPMVGGTAAASGSDFVNQVIELTNKERLHAGLPALKRQPRLQDSAGWLARDMSEHVYFDHRDSSQRDMPARLSDFKYDGYHAVGENIAMGQRTPEGVVRAWMHSPGHRANILSIQFSEIGAAYVPPSPRNGYGYWVQDFGSRYDSCPIVINTDTGCTSSTHIKISVHGADWVEQMRFSNDGVKWSSWEDFQQLRDWDLEPGKGKRTVFVEVRKARRMARVEATIQIVEPQPEPQQVSVTHVQ